MGIRKSIAVVIFSPFCFQLSGNGDRRADGNVHRVVVVAVAEYFFVSYRNLLARRLSIACGQCVGIGNIGIREQREAVVGRVAELAVFGVDFYKLGTRADLGVLLIIELVAFESVTEFVPVPKIPDLVVWLLRQK